MKSIRFSLIVCFLALVAVGLGAASALVYRIAAEGLPAKQAADRELLETKYKGREQEQKDKFDAELLTHARSVAFQAQTRYQSQRLSLTPLLALGLTSETQAHLF